MKKKDDHYYSWYCCEYIAHWNSLYARTNNDKQGVAHHPIYVYSWNILNYQLTQWESVDDHITPRCL